MGLVTGACFAEMGNSVNCYDIDKKKIELLSEGEVPIFEPGLQELIQRNLLKKRISFSKDLDKTLKHGSVIFIAVGTPSNKDGSSDLSFVRKAATSIGRNLTKRYKVVVNKSTVPVGTVDLVSKCIVKGIKDRGDNPEDYKFDVISNPEFLKEGEAIKDFMKPDRIIIGTSKEKPKKIMTKLYSPFSRKKEKIIFMDERSAELTKYASNSMLATRISFINEISRLAEATGANIEEIRKGLGSDKRIGHSFIYPGLGYGGSCLPKDVSSLINNYKEKGLESKLLSAVNAVNLKQKKYPINCLNSHFKNNLKDKTVSLWGLSFKPNTDDIREAPSLTLIKDLISAGCKVRAYDPQAMKEAEKLFSKEKNVNFLNSAIEALHGSNALVILTEWKEFRGVDLGQVKKKLSYPLIIDGRNIYDLDEMTAMGFNYYSVGRKTIYSK